MIWQSDEIDLDEVRAAISAGGHRASVVVPALDEESTVGDVVDAVRGALEEAEVVVVDGGSTDATVERARAAGARIIHQRDEIFGLDPAHGKGDALWKGLAQTSGDLVAFVDADVLGFESSWIVALLAPLVLGDAAFAKASYTRTMGDAPTGGGRVTEILARPLINAFWPDLTAIVQPLAGEYAGRRDLLERLPFPVGYGVEVGLLIDAAAAVGADAIAQVRLGSRSHPHQALPALGRMAAQVLATAATRLRDEGRLNAETTRRLRQPSPEGGFVDFEVDHRERPPLSTLRRN